MADYIFQDVASTSIPFKSISDFLLFDIGYQASQLILLQEGANVKVQYGIQFVILLNTTLSQLDGSQFTFADGGLVLLDIDNVNILIGSLFGDSIYGLDGDDEIYGDAGADTLNGGLGNDAIYGGDGADTLNGGLGNDALIGGDGNDIYLFAKGDGIDTIDNYELTVGKIDTVRFVDVLSTEVTLNRVGDDLILDYGISDQLTIRNYFLGAENLLEEFIFSDGKVWNEIDIKANVLTYGTIGDDLITGYNGGSNRIFGLDGADFLTGGDGADIIDGGFGDDNIYGEGGADTLNGGLGIDALNGGAGNDIYLFAKGDGIDTIDNYDQTLGKIDTVRFVDMLSTGVTSLNQIDNDLVLGYGSSDQLTISNYFFGTEYLLEKFIFSNGEVWNSDNIDYIINNPRLTFTAFTNAVSSVNEDTQTSISFDELKAQSNATDFGGTVTAFDIKSVTSGTLLIGVDANSAQPWDATNNFTVDAAHQIFWVPAANANGILNAFTAVAKDIGGIVSGTPVQATVEVLAVNDAPVAVNNTLSATEDTAVTYTAADLLGNDTDADVGTTLSIFSVTSGSHGSAVLNNDGTVTFTPTPNFNGAADFSYIATDGTAQSNSATVAVTVAAVNDVPTGSVTITGTPSQGQQLTASNNLVDADGMGTVTYTWFASGSAVSIGSGDTFTLTQAQVGKTITAVASYTDLLSTAESVSSSVTGTVANLNDLPTGTVSISGTPTQGQQLTASNNLVDVDGLGAITYTWYASGSALSIGTGDTFTLTQAQVGKTITAVASYTDLLGTAESVTSAVTSMVANINDAPIAVNDSLTATEDTAVIYTAAQLLGNDTDADGNPLTIASVLAGSNGAVVLNHDGTVTFTPSANFNGVANFTYVATDGTAHSNSATVTVNVATVNDVPVAVNETLIATEDTAITYTAAQLLANDTDADGNPLTIASVLAGSNGAVVLNQDGTVTFTPTANFNGVANFSYITTDGTAQSNSTTVTVTVAAANDSPTGAVIIIGSAIKSQTLTVTNSLADSDGLGAIAYQWLANGAEIAGETSTTLLLGEALVGKGITVQASYPDQQGTDEKVISLATDKVNKITNPGTLGADKMMGSQGNDVYIVNNPNDRITETKKAGIDTVVTTINYTLANNLENLTLSGTKALSGTGNTLNNTLIGNKANNVLDGGKGADKLMGGLGNDTYYVDNKGDKVTEEANAGTDTVISSISYVLGANLENLTLSGKAAINGSGNGLNNSLLGNASANSLNGLAGSDLIFGGLGKDKLKGGAGKDTFDFNTSLEIGKGASRDAILDFIHSEGDKIDLSGIDANSSKAGNQMFSFIGSKAFGGKAGELHFINGILSGDTDGKNGADFELSIKLVGDTTLVNADFVL